LPPARQDIGMRSQHKFIIILVLIGGVVSLLASGMPTSADNSSPSEADRMEKALDRMVDDTDYRIDPAVLDTYPRDAVMFRDPEVVARRIAFQNGVGVIQTAASARVRLDINEDGRVRACHVEQSSRIASLDSNICGYFVTGSHFYAALDADGNPVSSIQTLKLDFQPIRTVELKMQIDEDGGVTRCAWADKGLDVDPWQFCQQNDWSGQRDTKGAAVRGNVTLKLPADAVLIYLKDGNGA